MKNLLVIGVIVIALYYLYKHLAVTLDSDLAIARQYLGLPKSLLLSDVMTAPGTTGEQKILKLGLTLQ